MSLQRATFMNSLVLVLLLLFSGCSAVILSDIPVFPYPKEIISSASEIEYCLTDAARVQFVFNFSNENECTDIVRRATSRYSKLFFSSPPAYFASDVNPSFPPLRQAANADLLNTLKVVITVKSYDQCGTSDMTDMDEYYEIRTENTALEAEEGVAQITLNSNTIWGAIRGLESISQMLVAKLDEQQTIPGGQVIYKFCYRSLNFNDAPSLKWRGIMIDVARHFMPLSTLRKLIDGFAADKLNVLHLHLVDAQSFPIEIPDLGYQSYSSQYKLTYTPQQLKDLVAYAKDRGIRVVPEIDMPGHTHSWSVFGPNITVQCPPSLATNINTTPLNPLNENTYVVIEKIFKTLADIFPDKYLHIGGDELRKSCWDSDPTIHAFIQNNTLGIQNTNDLWGYFQKKVEGLLAGKVMICWQELALDLNTTFYNVDPSKSVVQPWKLPSDLLLSVQKGYKSILSGGYYLDVQKPYPTAANRYLYLDSWMDLYYSPLDMLNGLTQYADLVLGGEIAIWGEQIDISTIFARIWPRSSAIAEKFWSPLFVNDTASAQTRLIHHRCYNLQKRGVTSHPLRPDFCPYSLWFAEQPAPSKVELLKEPLVISLITIVLVLLFLSVGLTVGVVGLVIARKRSNYIAIGN